MPRAIDMHIHPPEDGRPLTAAQEEMYRYFRAEPPPKTSAEMADYYAERDILGCLLTIDATTARRDPGAGNDYIASIVKRYPKQFFGFCSVDPWNQDAPAEIRRAVQDLGLKGVKYHPSVQEFFPDDRKVFPQYEECVRQGVPVMFHTGMTGIGAGQPGGAGVKTKYCKPIPHIDDIAAEFPDLKIIMAHQAWPWVDEQLAVLVHKPNVYMDLSGYSPKYFDPAVITYANYRIPEKMLFGSDYPAIRPDRWLKDFEAASFRDEVREGILRGNAARLFGFELG